MVEVRCSRFLAVFRDPQGACRTINAKNSGKIEMLYWSAYWSTPDLDHELNTDRVICPGAAPQTVRFLRTAGSLAARHRYHAATDR